MLIHQNTHYQEWSYAKESDLEDAIQEVKSDLFGRKRIYIDTKKKIGKKGGKQNIPDAYVLDLTSNKAPKLFVVENELSNHEPLKHIAVQILEFSIAFEVNPQRVKEVLREALKAERSAEVIVAEYARANGYENLDYLLEQMVHRKEAFNALVIIDSYDPTLESVLKDKFRFPVELLTLERFRSNKGDVIYKFEPLLSDVDASDEGSELVPLDPAEMDTIVIAAQKEGFEQVFLGEDRWYKIRISASMIPQIQWIAAYQVAPISAITHIAAVKTIRPYKDSNKYEVVFEAPAEVLKPTKRLVKKGKVKGPQAPRYTSRERLMNAANLDEVF